jgi:crotonobetainyl-CoA:carnitine CoA-transferase CaiB-like acyl-CoA transferase
MAERSFDALDGVGVVEVGCGLRVAYCGALLAQLGAEVVQVGEAFEAEPAIEHSARRILNIAKRRARDLDEAFGLLDGRRVVLVSDGPVPAKADVEVVLQAHDAACCPALAGVHGNALSASAVAGASHAIGHTERAPLPVPEEFVEHTCGLHGAVAVLLALMKHGPGPHSVTVAMDECLRFYVGMNAKMYENYPREWRREGRRSAGSAGPYPVGMFGCSDGYVVIVSRSRADWHAILAAMGKPAWAERPGWDNPIEVAEHHADEADGYLEAWLGQLTCEQAVQLGGEHGFAIARMLDPLEAVTTEQMRSRGFATTTTAEAGGSAVEIERRLPAIVTRAAGSGPRRLATDTASNPVPRLLEGVRVLDLSWVWSGPAAAMMLAALGAQVIKVENRERPDGSRLRGRPTKNGVPVPGPELEVTPYFHQVNAGKLSVELDLGSDEGRTQILELAMQADVVIENMRPGVLQRHGLGYEAMSASNPSLVMLSMSLAGQNGPLRAAKGYASIMSALSGLESLVGYSPQDITGMLTVAVGDPNAATYGVLCVLAALLERERSGGRGAWLDLSQMEAVACGLLGTLGAFADGHAEDAWGYGNWHAHRAPHGAYPTRDGGWLALSVAGDRDWQALLDTLELPSHDDLRQARQRLQQRERVDALLATATSHRDRDELARKLLDKGVLAAPVLKLRERSPQGFACAARHTIEMEHPYGGTELLVTPPWDVDGDRPSFARRAPLLGEHDEQVTTAGWEARPAAEAA